MFKKNSNKINFKFSKFLNQNDLGTLPKITLSSFILVIFFYGMPLFIDYSKNKSNAYKNNSKAVLAYTLYNKGQNLEDGSEILTLRKEETP